MKLYYPITVDLYNTNPLPVMKSQQNNVGRGALITLTANGEVLAITEETVRIFTKRPDGFVSYLDCSILEDGKIQADFTDQMLSAKGSMKVELEFTTESTNITTPIFIVEVQESNVRTAVESSNEFKALETYAKEAVEAANIAKAGRATVITQKKSGETISITDAAPVPPLNIIPYGKSTQKQYEGNQLLDLPDLESYTLSGVTWSCKNGVVTAVGTTTQTTNTAGILTYNIPVISGTYYVSGGASIGGTVTGVGVFVQIKKADGTSAYYSNRSFTLDGTEVLAKLYLGIQSADVTVNTTIYPMLNKGTTALPWEPFVGGEASPSLSYKQEVVPLGAGGSIVEKLYSENLYGGRYYKVIYSNGILFAADKNEMTLPYIPSVPTLGLGKIIPCTAGQTYTMSVGNVNENWAIGVAEYTDIESAMSVRNQIGFLSVKKRTEKYITYTAKQNGVLLCGVCGIWSSEGTLIHTCTEDEEIQVELGTVATEYEAPATEQPLTYKTPNGLHGIPLGTTIPDAIKNSPIHIRGVYWDSVEQRYYIGNTKNENGKDVQRIREYGVDDFPDVGVSKDSKWYDSEKSYSYELKNMSTNSPLDYVGTALEKSTHFVGYNFQNFYNKGVESGFLRGQSYIVVNISKSLGICKTVDEFKQYCIDNNVKFYKILKTPIVTDTSEEELAQFNALRMNYPNTTVVNDAGAYTEVEYVCDTKEHIKQNYAPKSEIQEMKDQIADLQALMVNNS